MEKSDHFDGEHFFNPEARFSQSFWSTLKLMFAMAKSSAWEMKEPAKKFSLPVMTTKGDVAITFVNHASFVIQSSDIVVLTDPVWSKRASPFSFAGPSRVVEPGIALDALSKVDIVALSHNHYDHFDVETLKKLIERFDPVFLIPIGDKDLLEEIGATKIQELDWWDTADLPGGVKIQFAPSQHFSARGLFDRNRSLWGSYMITLEGQKIYFGGDTGYSSHFKEIRKRLGAPDLALLPIGAYEPYWFMGMIHMNPDDAVKAHLDLEAKQSIGMHFGTFKLTTESIDQPVKDLKQSLSARKVSEQKFTTLLEGESVQLNSSKLRYETK